jgi:hypothetical protein
MSSTPTLSPTPEGPSSPSSSSMASLLVESWALGVLRRMASECVLRGDVDGYEVLTLALEAINDDDV